MSMESAIKAMTAVQEAKAEPTTTQAAQETKVNETNGLQTSASVPATEEVPAAPGVVEETPSTEATTELAKAPAEEPLSAKFAALAKKERAIVKRQEEVKARDAEIAKRETAIAEREAKIQESEKLFSEDVFKALELRGYTYQKLTDMLLSGEKVAKVEKDPATLAKETIEQFKKEMADKEAATIASEAARQKELADKQAADLEAAYKKFGEEVREYTKQNNSEYELIELYGQHDLVTETVEAYYNENKRVLSVKEASDMVEAYLVAEAEKAFKARKFAPKTEPMKAAPVTKTVPQTKTLNNSMTPTTASALPAATEADRMKRALAALQASK